MRKVFHILPEGEAFSEFHGGAISRWVANVLRTDPGGVVVAADADSSWQYPSETVVSLRCMRAYRRLQRVTKNRTPWLLRKQILRVGLRSIISRLKPGDVIWVHNRPEFASAICRMVHRAGCSVVLHMHNLHLVTAKQEILEELQVDRIVFVSKYLLSASKPSLPDGICCDVLYNGADDELFTPVSPKRSDTERPIKILFASRLVREKGPHIFASALACLHSRGVAVEGIVVGGVGFGKTSPDRYVQDLIDNAPANLSFRPYCAGIELAKLFQEADIFCLPSVWDDPFPLAPLEAMAAGLPVVATRSGGIPEALIHGGGVLVGRNSAKELADALATLAADAMLRKRLSQAALKSFHRHFRWTNVRSNYQAIVEKFAHA